MAGHGRRINTQEGGRTVLPLSFTRHLPANTWGRVFTSLRPLVARSRQRTLSTYARRLQQRQQEQLSRVHNLEADVGADESNSPEWSPLLPEPSPTFQSPATPRERGRSSDEAGSSTVINIDVVGGASASPLHTAQSHYTPAQPLPLDTHNTNYSSPSLATTDVAPEQDNSAWDADRSTAAVLAGAGHEGERERASEEESGDPTRSASESINELLNQFPEIRSGLVVAWHYCIFLLILLAKAVFDHFTGLLILLGLAIGFLWSNSILKKAVLQQGRRPIKPLLALVVNLPAGIFLLYYSYGTNNLFYSFFLITPDFEGLGVMDLVWLVIVSDYIIKLATVLLKALITLLPHSCLHSKNRGKYFLVVEMASQLYRTLAPVQPWLAYLLDGYVGAQKVFGVLLSATYMVCKGPDIVAKMKAFQASVVKYMNSVNYGSTPSKVQLEDAGGMCPICHDTFQQPTMLACKHIFCEHCLVTWFDREQTCPMCRKQVADDPMWRDGGTSHFLQLY